MKKELAVTRKLNRILEIFKELDTQKEITIKGLADKFATSSRSIQRDINQIERIGYAIERPRKGVVKFSAGVTMKKPQLSAEQAAGLVFVKHIAKNMGSNIEKPVSALVNHLSRSAKDEAEIIPLMPKLSAKNSELSIEDLQEAINFCHVLKIRYKGFSSAEEKNVDICPLAILFSEGFLYALAFIYGKKGEYRTYRLDRIKKAEHDYSRTFSRPSQEYICAKIKTHSIWGVLKNKKIPISLKISGWAVDFFKAFIVVEGQKIKEEKGGSIRLEGNVYSFNEIIPQILRWMPCVDVLSPLDLKREIEKIVSDYALKNDLKIPFDCKAENKI